MKRMIAMVLAVLMVVTLAACSNKVKDIDGAEKGKTIEIDGKKVTIWQSHQIYKTE